MDGWMRWCGPSPVDSSDGRKGRPSLLQPMCGREGGGRVVSGHHKDHIRSWFRPIRDPTLTVQWVTVLHSTYGVH